MSVEIIDGIRVLKLKDGPSMAVYAARERRAVAQIWMLLGGGQMSRDAAIYSRGLL